MKKRPRFIEACRKIRLEKLSTDGSIIVLRSYARSAFREFERYLRFVIGLDEDDIQLILKPYNSNFVTYNLAPGIYTNKDIA